MTNNELQHTINSWFPTSVSSSVIVDDTSEESTSEKVATNGLEFTEEGSQFLNVTVQPKMLHDLMTKLKSTSDTSFDYLFCLTGMDWGEQLGVVYHLESTTHRHTIVVKVNADDREKPTLDTVCDIWKTADFLEREVFDFFGIQFNNHPNLKRLFLTDEWEGFPLRKDYVDEINMVIK